MTALHVRTLSTNNTIHPYNFISIDIFAKNVQDKAECFGCANNRVKASSVMFFTCHVSKATVQRYRVRKGTQIKQMLQ